VKTVVRAVELDKLLNECNFPSIAIHRQLDQEERYNLIFKKLLDWLAIELLRNLKRELWLLQIFSDEV